MIFVGWDDVVKKVKINLAYTHLKMLSSDNTKM